MHKKSHESHGVVAYGQDEKQRRTLASNRKRGIDRDVDADRSARGGPQIAEGRQNSATNSITDSGREAGGTPVRNPETQIATTHRRCFVLRRRAIKVCRGLRNPASGAHG
jgi:hypothetical protein